MLTAAVENCDFNTVTWPFVGFTAVLAAAVIAFIWVVTRDS